MAEASGLAEKHIRALIEKGCLPKASYSVTTSTSITSFFGEHQPGPQESAFYARAHLRTLAEIGEGGVDGGAILAAKLKREFCLAYRTQLENLDGFRWGLAQYFDGNGRAVGAALEALLEKEWAAYLAGIYGLCTRKVTAEDIAAKEVMIAKIGWLTDDFRKKALSPAECTELVASVQLLDRVSAPFAPHERERSSRRRFIDRAIETYGL